MQVVPGSVVGGFVVLRRLGKGGMGDVFAAEAPGGRQVAIKVLDLSMSDPDSIARFEREAEAHARVDAHPNVVRVHSFGRHGRAPYLVMDLLPGGDLGERLKAGPLSAEAVRSLGVALASGLQHVHAHGTLHRDIKPANILFDDEGRPCLADFGLARLVERTSLTQSGVILGTPGFMAPEQAGEGSTTKRTDVFGLAATLYAALSGHAPFQGQTLFEALDRLLNEAPPPLPQSVPANLRAAIVRGLSKKPEERFEDALSFAKALSTPPSKAPRAPLLVVATACVLGSLVLAAALLPWEEPSSPTPTPSMTSAVAVSTPAETPNEWASRALELPVEGRAACAWLGPRRVLTLNGRGTLKTWTPDSRGRPVPEKAGEIGTGTGSLLSKWPVLLARGRRVAWFGHNSAVSVWLPEGIQPSLELKARDYSELGEGSVLLFNKESVALWRADAPKPSTARAIPPPSQRTQQTVVRAVHCLSLEGSKARLLVAWGKGSNTTGLADGTGTSWLQEVEMDLAGQVSLLRTVPVRATVIRSICRRGDELFLGDEAGGVWVWSALDLKPRRPLARAGSESLGQIRGLALAAGERLVSLSQGPCRLRVWSRSNDLVLDEDMSRVGVPRGEWLRLSSDGEWALVQGEEGVALVPIPQ